jgi:flagellar M-ring protein FliF
LAALTGIVDRFTTWWKGANATQRALVVGGIVAGAVSTSVVLVWTSQPDFVVLFSGLGPEDASAIVDELVAAEVPYRVNTSGGTILVPQARVGELRIRVAGKGLTGSRTVGYEVFDRSSLGMTEFLQHVNYRRALEGELTRTVLSLSEVRNARVHLAIPEQGVFNRDRRLPTASVILDLKPGARLEESQVRGIYALMAASVEGLEPSGVTIVDSTGRELGAGAASGELAATSEQLRVQQEVEEYLRNKATSLLEQVVGAGEATVQVHAELDFERVERSVERFDPGSATVRSEQRTSGSAAGGESQETILTNYEIDKTIESILESVGGIRRLSIAVLVNGSYQPGEGGELAYVERGAPELAALKAIVEDAVGYDAERGDSLEIANLRFAERPGEDISSAPPAWWLLFPSMGSLLRSLVVLAAIALVAWALRQSSRILVEAVEQDRRRRERVLAVESSASEAEIRKEVIREEMNNLAKERPSEVAQVLRGWLIEEKPS